MINKNLGFVPNLSLLKFEIKRDLMVI